MSGEDKSEGAGEAGMKTGYIGILAVGLMIGIIIGVAVGAFAFPRTQSVSVANELAPGEAGKKVTDFITNYSGYFRLPPGIDIALINVTEVENANLYKIVINISVMGKSETVESYMTKDGKLLFLGGIEIEEFEERVEQQRKEAENRTREPQQQQNTTIGNFIVSGDEICREDGKPIIYFFGSERCGYCKWEQPVMVNVTSKFEGYISFHENIDTTRDSEIFGKYNPRGGVPTLVLGCKYYRVGAGTSMGEEQEAKVLTALICDLTDNKPVDVCTDPEIEEWINRIE